MPYSRMFFSLFTVALGLTGRPVRAVDPSPTERFITVNGAKLFIIDWGGQGPTLILLPGYGNGAHIFDTLAPELIDHYRVVALTPRGFPPSGTPDSAVTVTQLAMDVAGLADSLGASTVILAGHSISGAVITRFASLYPQRLRAAVYLDAAFDYQAAAQRSAMRPRLELGSVDTTRSGYQTWRRRYPEWDSTRARDSEMWDLDSAEVARRQRVVTPLVDEVRAQRHQPWLVKVPTLVISAIGNPDPRQSMPRAFGWLTPDSTRWEPAVSYLRDAYVAKHKEDEYLRSHLSGVTVAELESGHYIFLDRHDDVVHLMLTFLAAVR